MILPVHIQAALSAVRGIPGANKVFRIGQPQFLLDALSCVGLWATLHTKSSICLSM